MNKSATLIGNLLKEIGGHTKQAGSTPMPQGVAEPNTEHPSKDVPGGSRKAPAGGEQDAANDEAATAVAGPAAVKGANVFKKAEATVASPEDGGNLQIGTTKLPTGKDPANEKPKAMTVQDPGTSHPAKSDSNAPGVAKCAFSYDASASTEKLATELKKHSDAVLAALVVEKAASTVPTPAANTTPLTQEAARQSGWELAGIAGGLTDKVALQRLAQQDVYILLKQGQDDGLRVATLLKEAAAAMAAPAPAAAPAAPARASTKAAAGCGGGKAKMKKKAGEGEEPDDDDSEESSPPSSSGGGSEGGSSAPPAETAPPPAPGGGGGGAGGGDGMAELAQVIAQLGITPQEVAAALMQSAGGGGGAPADPAAGAAPAGGMPPAPPGGGMEVMAAMKTAAAAGAVPPQAGQANKQARADRMANTIQDIVRRV